MEIDLIIFDCDGTLTDSEAMNNKALLDVVHQCGYTQYTMEHALKHWVGSTITNIGLMIQMETGKPVPVDLVERYMVRLRTLHEDGLAAIDGAQEFVQAAASRMKICVASNGERSNVIHSLKVTGLLDYFGEGYVFTKSQVKRPKPEPDLFLHACSQMNGNPAKTLVIEDSLTGVMAGVAAGMHTWGFTGSSHTPDAHEKILLKAGAGRVFSRLIHMKQTLSL
jgi:HAD superfamily hydrolase (TIGR01509 family)